MVHDYPGKYIVLDGLDGIGKGTGIKALVDYEVSKGKKVFDIDDYQMRNKSDPSPDKFESCDIIVCSEPTFAFQGAYIRDEIIACRNSGKYSAGETAQYYARDRQRSLNKYVLPALVNGKTVIQSRSVSTSIIYQPVQAEINGEDIGLDYILGLDGNRFALDNFPDLLIVPTINDVNECLKRLESRDKSDDAIFESINFQMKFKPRYESGWFKDIFQDRGTRVVYVDAGVSPEHTSYETVRIYCEFLSLLDR